MLKPALKRCLPACGWWEEAEKGCTNVKWRAWSLSFSSKYYQLIHINRPRCCKFLLNELPTSLPVFSCLPDLLIAHGSGSASLSPTPSHVPVTPGHGFIASTRSAQLLSWLTSLLPAHHTVWQQHLPWKTVNASHPHTATMTETPGMARTVSLSCRVLDASATLSGQWAFFWCSVPVLCSSCPAAQSEPASAGWVPPYIRAGPLILWNHPQWERCRRSKTSSPKRVNLSVQIQPTYCIPRSNDTASRKSSYERCGRRSRQTGWVTGACQG